MDMHVTPDFEGWHNDPRLMMEAHLTALDMGVVTGIAVLEDMTERLERHHDNVDNCPICHGSNPIHDLDIEILRAQTKHASAVVDATFEARRTVQRMLDGLTTEVSDE